MAVSNPTFSRDECAWIVERLRDAWPRVKRVKLDARTETRQPGEIRDRSNGTIAVDISITAPAEELLALGLTTPALLAKIPQCGSHQRLHYGLIRSKSGVRVSCYWGDTFQSNGERPPEVEAVWNAMARVVASALWTPRKDT